MNGEEGGTGPPRTEGYPPMTHTSQKLSLANVIAGMEGDQFGGSGISISGNWAIIAAYHDDDGDGNQGAGSDSGAGAAYMYKRVGNHDGAWEYKQTIRSHDIQNGDYFGFDTAIDGDWAIVGAYGEDRPGYQTSGAAYMFKRNGDVWEETAGEDGGLTNGKITSPSPATSEYFGRNVAISGDYALVAAPLGSDAGGRAYIFKRRDVTESTPLQWTHHSTLKADPEPAFGGVTANDDFANTAGGAKAIAIDSDWAIIGAYRNGLPYPGPGRVYMYKREGDVWGRRVGRKSLRKSAA